MVQTIECPITGEAAIDLGPTAGGWRRIRCDAAGGTYEITHSAEKDMAAALPKETRPRLVTWLVDQQRTGTPVPRVTAEVLERVRASERLRVVQRVERMYRMLQLEVRSIGSGLPWNVSVYETDATKKGAQSTRARLRAWTESSTDEEVETLVRYGTTKGFVREEPELALTIDGWAHLEALDAPGAGHDQAFVAMWFNADVAEAYREGIEPAIKEVGYVPMRIDRKEHNNKIDDEIVAEIKRSRFLVADFTCGSVQDLEGKAIPLPRGGVYYEAGYAQGLGIPVIWMCREDHIGHVHFDTRQFNHITWSTPVELREKLVHRIGAVLGDGPRKATKAG